MESGDQIRGDSSTVDQIQCDLQYRASPYHLPLIGRQREIDEAVTAVAALQSRPPLCGQLNATTRHHRGCASAAQPWKRETACA